MLRGTCTSLCNGFRRADGYGRALGRQVIAIGLAITAALDWSDPASIFLVSGAMICVLGSALVTILFNVPLNKNLAAARPEEGQSADA